jgi:hypothetical protein
MLQTHPWFKGVAWDRLYEMDAAFKPEVNGELDTQNFEKFEEVDALEPYFCFCAQNYSLDADDSCSIDMQEQRVGYRRACNWYFVVLAPGVIILASNESTGLWTLSALVCCSLAKFEVLV